MTRHHAKEHQHAHHHDSDVHEPQPSDELKDKQDVVTASTTRKRRKPVNGDSYHAALTELESVLHRLPIHDSDMYTGGMDMCSEIRKIGNDKERRPELTQMLKLATRLARGHEAHADGEEGYRRDADEFHVMANHLHRFPFGKVIGGLMLGFLGAAIVVASGILAAVSFGLLAPISVFGTVLGVSTVVGGVSVVTGAIGLAANMASGALFFKAAQRDPLQDSAKKFENGARVTYGISR